MIKREEDDDAFFFLNDENKESAAKESTVKENVVKESVPEEAQKYWKVLIVDDEEEVHVMTRIVLNAFEFEGRPLNLISAYSGSDAKRLIVENPDTAVILLDVVMEKDHSGLDVIRFIREELKFGLVRIILRTGQPGQAPEEQVIVRYDINDYKEKTELTRARFFTAMISAIRAYRDLIIIESNRRGLEKINERLELEIQKRKQVEKEIRASLRDKEVLLKEVHHRVKNNLQIISSLLYLHSIRAKELCAREALNESRNRIRSIALVHEKLYKSGNVSTINFSEYLRSLISDLLDAFDVNSETITLQYDVETHYFGLDTAIPCSLIINEIISNSLKYAFPESTGGIIHISLHKLEDDGYELLIGDNGIGLPDSLDPGSVDSLGLRLINTLAEQIEGTVEMNRAGGTSYKITFRQQSEPC
ncbi:MAG: hypothetical protein HQK89_17060 [Nitrospirae bacterium]|nr:hypothetical protein [Nitrospirota bacterium]